MNNNDNALLAELKICETRVWQALLRGDAQADAAALHPEFLGVYADGFAGKDDHVGQLADGPTIKSFSLSACRILRLGAEHAVFSYRADFVRCKKTAPEAMYVSSIWQKDKAGWRNVFSQDTFAIE